MFRSTSLRLAALYTAVFAVAVVALGLITFLATRQALQQQFDNRVRAEATALAQEYRTEGLQGVVDAVRERDHTPGALRYGLRRGDAAAVAGRLGGSGAPLGWSTVQPPDKPRNDAMRVLAVQLPDGYILLVGDEADRVELLDGALLRGFGLAFAGIVVLGVVGGFAFSREVGRRLAAISGTAEAIIDGDLGRRVPVRGSDDDLDRLAHTINRMLDRIATLMDSLRQVSSDVAHDLRTPLTRLRNRLEASIADPEERGHALEGALGDLDAILDTFTALLRIAQIEGGARHAGFAACDLTEIARTVVDAFAPSAEEAGQTLMLSAAGAVPVEGDRELLTQMLVNLVENALRHAGGIARIEVWAEAGEGGPRLTVRDDGPGVPAEALPKLTQRFFRLERSRSTPGSGLGLALVAAVAKLHGGEVELRSPGQGLEACVRFPR